MRADYPSLQTLIQKLDDGQIRSKDLAEQAQAAYARVSGCLDGYRIWLSETAAATADAADIARSGGNTLGALQGIPCSVKDNFALKSAPLYAGAAKALPERFNKEGPVIGALRRQLCPILGKTYTDEFAYGGIGAVCHGPIPRNPWDVDHHRLAGGSSSGAGVSLLDGTAHFALATDTSGSVRRPAAMTGTVGMKLTFGRWSVDGVVPLTQTLDTPGFLTRTVADAIEVFRSLDPHPDDSILDRAERQSGVEGLRIGICTNHFWDDCSPGIAESLQEALSKLESKGAILVDLEIPEVDQAYEVVRNGGVVASEFYAFLTEELPEFIEVLHPYLGGRMSGSDKPDQTAVEYLRNLMKLDTLARSAGERLLSVDAVVTPTVPITAPLVSEVADLASYEKANALGVRNTYIPSLLQLNATSIPAGMDACGIPVGLHLITANGQEEKALAIALQIERVLGSGLEQFGRPPVRIV